MKIKIEKIAYHRNGVAGEGFHVATFICPENKTPMVGIVFEGGGQCAVFNRQLLGEGVIERRKNSWRGDCYESDLREAIKQFRGRDEE
jgi:hypothetical protein